MEDRVRRAAALLDESRRLARDGYAAAAVERLQGAAEAIVDEVAERSGVEMPRDGNAHSARVQAAEALRARKAVPAGFGVLLKRLDQDRVATKYRGRQSRFDEMTLEQAQASVEIVLKRLAADGIEDDWERRGGGVGITGVGVRRSDGNDHSEAWRVVHGRVEHRWVSAESDWRWSDWHDFDAPAEMRDVAAVSGWTDHVEVFLLARDGTVWHRWWRLHEGWSAFERFGKPMEGADAKAISASSRGEGQMDVYVDGFSGQMRLKWFWHEDGWADAGPYDGWHAFE